MAKYWYNQIWQSNHYGDYEVGMDMDVELLEIKIRKLEYKIEKLQEKTYSDQLNPSMRKKLQEQLDKLESDLEWYGYLYELVS